MSHLFVSHSSHDNEQARRVFDCLASHGYQSMFLDFDPEMGIPAGRDWEKELYRNLKLAGAVVALYSDHFRASKWCFAEVAQARAMGKPIFPVIVSPSQSTDLLADRQAVDLSGEGDTAFLRLLAGLRAAGFDPKDSLSWEPSRPPYPGLNSLHESDAGVFFGRDDEVRQVLEALTRMQRRSEPRFALIVGASGCGKSSLMRAGVLPRLKKDAQRWVVIPPFRPAADPISEMARSVSSAFSNAHRRDWKSIRNAFRVTASDASSSPDPLADIAADLTIALDRREASVLVVIDQLEEALQVRGDAAAAVAEGFFRLVRRAAGAAGSSVFVLATLRSDFFGTFQNHPSLCNWAFTDIPLGPMRVENFPLVIEGPARRAGIELAEGLVAEMVADTKTNDALPLLAFTLRAMYDRTTDPRRFTRTLYGDDLGGIQGAISMVVAQIRGDLQLAPGSRTEWDLRRAFMKLVRLDADGHYIRKAALWDALPEGARPVLSQMIDARLLASEGTGPTRTVEVVHESLFRVWDDLARWLSEKREMLLWRESLRDELAAWKVSDESPAYLLSGGRVAEARRMLATDRDEFEPEEIRFATASIQEEDRKATERRRLFQRVRFAAMVAGCFGVLATVGGVLALRQTRVAQSRELAARADRALTTDPIAALSLAVKAQKRAPTSEAEEALTRALITKRVRSCFRHAQPVLHSSFSPEQSRIVTASSDNTARIWDAETGRELVQLTGHNKWVAYAAFTPDGTRVITAGGDQTVRVWSSTSGRELHRIAGSQTNSFFSGYVSMSADGSKLVTVDGKGYARVWDVLTGRQLIAVGAPDSGIVSATFSPRWPHLLTIGEESCIWNAESGRKLQTFPKFRDNLSQSLANIVRFTPDGTKIAATSAAGSERIARLWDVTTGKELQQLPHPLGWALDFSFSPDGTKLVTADTAEGAHVWDVATGKRVFDLGIEQGSNDGFTAAEYSPAGDLIVTAGEDGNARIWDARDGRELALLTGHSPKSSLSYASFSRAGDKIVTAGADDSARVWDARFWAESTLLQGHTAGVNDVAYSPDSAHIVTASDDHSARIWDARTGRQIRELAGHNGRVVACAFSHDGMRVLTVGRDEGVAHLWDADTGARLDSFAEIGPSGARVEMHDAAFSPGDMGIIVAGPSYVHVYDIKTHELVLDLPIAGWVSHVSYSRDGSRILVTSDRRAVLFDAADGKVLADPPGYTSMIYAADVSPDGSRIVTADQNAARIRSLKGPGEGLMLAHGNWVSSALFAYDGRCVVTASADNSIRLWDATTGREIHRYAGHKGMVDAIALSSDGSEIATASRDKTVRLFRTRFQFWLDVANRRLPIGLLDANGDLIRPSY